MGGNQTHARTSAADLYSDTAVEAIVEPLAFPDAKLKGRERTKNLVPGKSLVRTQISGAAQACEGDRHVSAAWMSNLDTVVSPMRAHSNESSFLSVNSLHIKEHRYRLKGRIGQHDRRRLRISKFDSTLGYPGEGPGGDTRARASRDKKFGPKKNHVAAARGDRKNSDLGEVKDALRATVRAGVGATALANAIDTTDGKKGPRDPTPEQDAKALEEKAMAQREKEIASTHALFYEMRDEAASVYYRSSLVDRKDLKVVKSKLNLISKAGRLSNLLAKPHVFEVFNELPIQMMRRAHSDGRKAALDARLADAQKNLLVFTDMKTAIDESVDDDLYTIDEFSKIPEKRLEELEEVPLNARMMEWKWLHSEVTTAVIKEEKSRPRWAGRLLYYLITRFAAVGTFFAFLLTTVPAGTPYSPAGRKVLIAVVCWYVSLWLLFLLWIFSMLISSLRMALAESGVYNHECSEDNMKCILKCVEKEDSWVVAWNRFWKHMEYYRMPLCMLEWYLPIFLVTRLLPLPWQFLFDFIATICLYVYHAWKPYGLSRVINEHLTHNLQCLKEGRPEDMLLREYKVLGDLCCRGKVPVAPTSSTFEVAYGDPKCVKGFGGRVYWCLEQIPRLYRSCICNEEVSLSGRVGKDIPAVSDPDVKERVKQHWLRSMATNTFKTYLNTIPRVFKPLNFGAWLSTFPPARREALRRCKDDGDTINPTAKAFIKKEKSFKLSTPRWIQGCSLALSVLCGPFIRKLAKKFRNSIKPASFSAEDRATGRHIIYTCGLNNAQIGAALSEAALSVEAAMDDDDTVVYIEDDQSRFDLHLTEGAFLMLDKIYSVKLPRKQANALRRGKSKGVSPLGTKYNVDFTMQSGWPDTSLGDTMVNAHMKLQIHGSGNLWYSIINGDDSVTVTTKKSLAKLGGISTLVKEYARFGMEVEMKKTTDILSVEFCSARFCPTKDSLLLVPKTGKLLARILVDDVNRAKSDRLPWVSSIRTTLETFGAFDMVLGALGAGLARHVASGPARKDQYKINYLGVEVDETSQLLMYQTHYGLCNSDIELIVAELRNVQLGTRCNDKLINHMLSMDI